MGRKEKRECIREINDVTIELLLLLELSERLGTTLFRKREGKNVKNSRHFQENEKENVKRRI